MHSHITKWGNSLGVHIPLSLARQVGILEGDPIELQIEDDFIAIRKVKYSLNELLAQVKPDNLHKEIKTGNPVGKEEW